ncbi:predicted protein [Postia placenta Mad-698-R]|uniref:Uncharacterized protein n=1 Tax=Postia placenta MAD-698-R-SB12 TaxID=670580 RepID=A0A1X6MR63_9APHY|nr:hypothetical protein POSPLADRAFT_1035844 [Postia placenta MAD-698-R-SB12]EED84300.1 predicted protein [Postia placenta Mad-698-R]OSX58716.1 hypothetical protein POSPLADRAFT_1035844 [Postia placenta MAD-698-R-SB12]
MAAPLRKVYIASYDAGGLFPNHWALWVPSVADENIGTIIQVEGDPATGFHLEFQRYYDKSVEERKHALFEIADVEHRHVVDSDGLGDGKPFIETVAHDAIEEQAVLIDPPAKSLKSAGNEKQGRVEIKNCQTWLTELVNALVAQGIFPESALTKLAMVPKATERKQRVPQLE